MNERFRLKLCGRFFSNLTCFCYNPCVLPYLCAPPLLPVATCAVVCCVQCIPAGFLTVSKWVTLIMFCNICMLIHINSAISRKTLLKPLICKVWAGSHMVLLTASWPGCKCVCLLTNFSMVLLICALICFEMGVFVRFSE